MRKTYKIIIWFLTTVEVLTAIINRSLEILKTILLFSRCLDTNV